MSELSCEGCIRNHNYTERCYICKRYYCQDHYEPKDPPKPKLPKKVKTEGWHMLDIICAINAIIEYLESKEK